MARKREDRMMGLGELQLEVFDRLSEMGEATVQDVVDAFPKGSRPRYTTALTVLRALEKKGLVDHRAEGRTYIFRPTTEQRDVRRNIVVDLLKRAFGGSPSALVAALVDTGKINDKELERVRAIIEKSAVKRDDQ